MRVKAFMLVSIVHQSIWVLGRDSDGFGKLVVAKELMGGLSVEAFCIRGMALRIFYEVSFCVLSAIERFRLFRS